MPSMVHIMAGDGASPDHLRILRERHTSRAERRDEREGNRIACIAGRNAFLVGSLLLIIGIGYQSLMHSLDLWLPH